MHIIPRTTKVKSEIIKGVTASDLIFMAITAVGAIALFTGNFPFHYYIGFSYGKIKFVFG